MPFMASAATLTVQSLSPGSSVMAKNKLSFSLVTSGFTAYLYQVQDSFSGSSVANTNVDGGGNFQWVPLVSDVGTHTLTITSRDFNDNSATVTQTITVLPPPSISIHSASGVSVMPGETFSFTVSHSGFTNPIFSIGDEFNGSSATYVNIGPSGNFSWKPDFSQNGQHRITVYASDSQGRSASANVDVQVGAGPRLVMQLTSTSTTILPGNFVSFNVNPVDFNPTGYSVTDSFSGQSSISNANINSSGAFWWMPQGSDVGVHKLTIYGQVGAFGDKASTTQTITVLGPDGVVPPSPSPIPASTASSSTVLATLQAQLAALMAKMTGQTGGTASPTPPSSATLTGYTFTSYLKPGMRGDEVLELQKVLAALGLLTATPNGYFGVGTTAAVQEFQKQHGLEQLGVVGPATRAALNALGGEAVSTQTTSGATLASGFKFEHFMGYGDDTLPNVLELQNKLKALGYLGVEPTGFYGSATEAAVKKFQTARGLAATGYCDRATRAELNK
jgi:peptidoglycan hydrolase-like protein with peptidoglycan-binding domain